MTHPCPDRRQLLLGTLALLGGCASPPAPSRAWAETAARELQLAVSEFELQGRRVTLTRRNVAAGPLPVVVYLPGIGQDGDAGQRWAAAWALAGHAMLAVQPLEDDAAAWRSPLARTGEFRALGELHYGEAMRAARLAALRRLVPALQAHAGAALDWQRGAIAGYEIGAQTALDLGAEAAGWQPRAAIAISPPPMDAAAATPPALLITSDIDGDALGLVTRPAERRRAFDAMQPGAGWLLSLAGVSHAALSGTLAPEGWQEQDQHRGHAVQRAPMGVRAGPMPAGGVPRGPRSGSATEAALADLNEALRVSAAFLDARLRGAAMPVSPLLTTR
ncbi:MULTISPECIES: hypothetical protein [unclassified Roseateles]|uniref:hypothetical protein n=1 Tax=unclassified Roseateles TaxID=2626991 RepID=UPI0006F4F4B8|nr:MULTISPECIES: hypothetical protein [unclassified Roseateles]KQW45492.1 hypothetical protein ASC81_11315 [Pelomonas sp. Root405]KRA72336.1 hypothetical protein ASD88_11315 [Pelomonas sp. Root662]